MVAERLAMVLKVASCSSSPMSLKVPSERQPNADSIRPPDFAYRLDHFYEQPHPVLDRTAISVGAPIGARIDELVASYRLREHAGLEHCHVASGLAVSDLQP